MIFHTQPIHIRIFIALFFIASCSLISSCEEEDDDSEPEVENAAPTSFDLVFISDNAAEVVLSPYLSWTASTDSDGGTITYQLLMDKTGDLTSAGLTDPITVLAEDITTNYYAMTQGLLQATEYTWRIVAVDGQGGSTNSTSVFSFITAENGMSNSPPSDFDLFSPVDLDMNVPLSPQLTWEQAVDPDGDPVLYDIYLEDLNFNPGLISSMNPNLSTIPISLDYDTEYLWEVLAYDNHGAYTWSESIFLFKTIDEPGPITMSQVTTNSPTQTNGRFGHQMVVHNGELYVIGGFVLNGSDGGDRNDVWKTSDMVNWVQVREHDSFDLNAPHASSESQVVSYEGFLYVFNGERNTIQISSDGAVWSQVPWLGNVSDGTHYPPIQGHQVVVFNDRLFVIGGSSGGQVNNDVWVSDDLGITWTEVSDHNFLARRDHQVVVLNNELFLIGGVSGGVKLNDVWSSSDGLEWSEEPFSVPWDGRLNHHCAAFNGTIYMSGGDVAGDTDEIWRYDPNSFNWEQIATHPDYGPRESHHSIVFNNELFITYGKNVVLPLNDTWVFD